MHTPFCSIHNSKPCSTTAVEGGLNSSTELDYFTDDPEDELVSDKEAALKPDIRRKIDAYLPPSSHESPSLLYDPLARSESSPFNVVVLI